MHVWGHIELSVDTPQQNRIRFGPFRVAELVLPTNGSTIHVNCVERDWR